MKKVVMFFILSFFLSCGITVKHKFDFNNAEALALLESTGNNASDILGNLLNIDVDGNTSLASETALVNNVYSLNGGALLKLQDGLLYYVDLEGNQLEIDIKKVGSFIGQNKGGNLIFSNGEIFNINNKKYTKISTNLKSYNIIQHSGNFIILDTGEITQVYDTVTNKRYNIQRCNGPKIAALSESKVFVDDCTDKALMDMTDGSRVSIVNFNSFNGEFILIDDGAIFLSQGCPLYNDYTVCKVSSNGIVSSLISEASSYSQGDITNNKVLFGTGNYFVVKELNKIWYAQIGVDKKNIILSDLNVLTVKVKGSIVYYTAEDTDGNPVSGQYNISSNSNTDIIYQGVKIKDISPIY